MPRERGVAIITPLWRGTKAHGVQVDAGVVDAI